MAKKEDKQEQKIDPNSVTKTILSSILKDNQSDHYNHVEAIHTSVSSGSLFLDAEITFTEGIHRFGGPSGAGKTSEAANICKNFLREHKRGKVLWVKAEGRLGDKIQKRSGVKFVEKESEWDYGTAFILESNTFEFICQIIETFVKAFREVGDRLLIVIDSVDGLKLKSDAQNALGKERTAGPQLIMKRFLKEMYYPLVKNGVICIAISQVTATIAKDDYSPPALVSGGGGNALLHWSSYILEFSGRNWGDHMFQNGPNTKFDADKNPIVGHMARVTIKKTDAENEMKRVEYPIKHGRLDGKSIWVEFEIITFAKKWGLIDIKASWYSFPEQIIKDVKDKLKLDLVPKLQGFNAMLTYLEENPTLTEYLFNRINMVERNIT